MRELKTESKQIIAQIKLNRTMPWVSFLDSEPQQRWSSTYELEYHEKSHLHW